MSALREFAGGVLLGACVLVLANGYRAGKAWLLANRDMERMPW